jgi:hypothetical protein
MLTIGLTLGAIGLFCMALESRGLAVGLFGLAVLSIRFA